jgi:hypothetical protein
LIAMGSQHASTGGVAMRAAPMQGAIAATLQLNCRWVASGSSTAAVSCEEREPRSQTAMLGEASLSAAVNIG